MKNNWKESFEENYNPIIENEHTSTWKYGAPSPNSLLIFIGNLLAEQKKELMEEERQFILNVLDGIDIADKQMGVIGGTQAIRQALQSRVI